MEKHQYICQFCQKEFEPRRRKVQKFCSATCRSKNHHHSKPKKITSQENLTGVTKVEKSKNNKTETKIEKISAAGIGNAALGNMASDATTTLLKSIFTPENNKPVTKRDFEELKKMMNTRFLPVINITSDLQGRKAYYDKETGNIVFYNEQLHRYELPMMDL